MAPGQVKELQDINMIQELVLKDVGPAPSFDVAFAHRLNLIAGDNGLGKSFLLDVVWWALTGTWAGYAAAPHRGNDKRPTISCVTAPGPDGAKTRGTVQYKPAHGGWGPMYPAPPPSLVIYAQADGGFSVWDPARNYPSAFDRRMSRSRAPADVPDPPAAYLFTPRTLWHGLEENGNVLCNGLIRDWVSWQNQPGQDDTSPFRVLARVLEHLSLQPDEWMKPGPPTRVSTTDVRDIPTISLPYGDIPVLYASAGMKRVLSLAYVLVWTWYEHQKAAALVPALSTDRLVLLIDEVEAHLHPRWQRAMLPALLEVAGLVGAHLGAQVIATTHSPLVTASIEPHFEPATDNLFLFDVQGQNVTLTQVPWAKQGDIVGWATSEVFGLRRARSREAEQAIDAAEAQLPNSPRPVISAAG